MLIRPDLLPLILSAIVAIAGATVLGYFLGKGMGAALLALLALTAAVLCYMGASHYQWTGLILAIAGVTILAILFGYALSRQRGARTFGLMWLGWCGACLLGYLSAGIAGLVFITFSTVAMFWIGTYKLVQKALPLREGVSRKEKLKAFRALLTFTLGRNYPYYSVENRKKIPRVPGNQFAQFMAGPGIVITSCDHTVVITDNIKIKQVPEPGLTFTEMFETIGEVIDLRAQLRAFDVEALTKDGIRIKVLTFVPFRIDSGRGESGRWPKSGEAFPFNPKAVFRAVQAQLVERSREKKDDKVVENVQKHSWDALVKIIATRIVRQIISEYSFDDLCAPYNPNRDPRQDIGNELRHQLRGEMSRIGIDLIGGGISNLMPADGRLLQQRIGNWQAEWERRISKEIGQGEAEYIRMVESARAQAQAEMIRTISEGFEQAGGSDEVSTEVVALRFVEALEKMIKSPDVQPTLPPGTAETAEAMRRSLEVQRR
jgi:hypothetical protein